MSDLASLTQNWTLVRYAVEINQQSPLSSPNSGSSNERHQPQRQIIDCTEGLLRLSLTTSQQLYVVRDETEKIECVDLLAANSSSVIATYTGDSLLISYLIPNDHLQRKFLIKFASTSAQNASQNCRECVTVLSRYLHITHLDAISKTNSNELSSAIVSMADMIQALMNEQSFHLSRYYQQEISLDSNQANEFLEKYLSDETFPDFVANVASILDSIKDNSK